jgi:hypothetical protein
MLAEGQVRMSERELDQLKAAAAGIAPKKAAPSTQKAPAAAGGLFGGFGGLFGGAGGGGGRGAPEVVDLPGALPTRAAAPPAAKPVPPPPAPVAPTAWKSATDPASGAPYWYNEATGESSWTPPPGVAPIGPPPGAPPAAGAGFSATAIGKRLEAQPGTKVVPKPGLTVPFYWQEGIEYGIDRRNKFVMDEIVGIRRCVCVCLCVCVCMCVCVCVCVQYIITCMYICVSICICTHTHTHTHTHSSDGDIKFGTIMNIAQGREGNVYQVPHVTCMYPHPHMTCMYPPPQIACA